MLSHAYTPKALEQGLHALKVEPYTSSLLQLTLGCCLPDTTDSTPPRCVNPVFGSRVTLKALI